MKKVMGVDDGKETVLGDAGEDVRVGEKVGGVGREESGLDCPQFRAMNRKRVLGMVSDRMIELGRNGSVESEGAVLTTE